ncbi:MAG: response regulator [Gemmatimonadaceae bacterium]|jgi:two-component system chemotaxis response regulator CheY|nr:response regulator [Gemmatimonadaceae bacterium]
MALNVLVVDDSAVMRAMIVRTLKLSGVPLAEIHQAGNGEEGLRVVRDEWVDLVLLDVNMPVMNGEEMLTALRAEEATRALPVIVVSTESSDTRLARLTALDARIVHKPFPPETLRAMIAEVTGHSGIGGSHADEHDVAALASDSADF